MKRKCDIWYSGNKLSKDSILEISYLMDGTLGYSFTQYLFKMHGILICPFISKNLAEKLGVI